MDLKDIVERYFDNLQERIRREVILGMESCDSCEKTSNDIISCKWMAGRKSETKQYDPVKKFTGSGYQTTTITETSYRLITPIMTGFCPKCFRKGLNRRKIIAALLILVTITVLISIYQNTLIAPQVGIAVKILLLLILIPVSIRQLKHFKKADVEFHRDMFVDHAHQKKSLLGLDTLWTPEEYSSIVKSSL